MGFYWGFVREPANYDTSMKCSSAFYVASTVREKINSEDERFWVRFDRER
jgi:hypothetical protein